MGASQQMMLAQKIASGGGGGALSLTLLQQVTSGNTHGTGSYSPASVTPTAGRRVIVVIDAQSSNNDAQAGGDITLSSSGGGITSWTPIVATTTHPNWGYGSRAFVADQAATATSLTLTVDCGAFAIENYRVTTWEAENYGGIGGTAIGSDSDGGPASITLSQAPLSTSIVIATLNAAMNSGNNTVTEGTDFTELASSDVNRTDWWGFQKQTRTGSTSTTVGWQNVAATGAQLGCSLMAFEVLQA